MKSFSGVVQKGTKRAAALGFPTVNISFDDPHISGIYAARVVVGGRPHIAAAFADQKRKILEAHVFNATLDLYGKEITVELHQKIRDSSTFESDDALRAAIEEDIRKVGEYFRQPV